MSDHPTTFNAEPADLQTVQWDDRASLHLAGDGGGVLDGGKGLGSGTLADMIARVMTYPSDERGKYVIEKAGDHRLTLAEIEALAARPDYPRS